MFILERNGILYTTLANFLFKFLLFLLMVYRYICVHIRHVGKHSRWPEKGIGCSGTGVTGNCEPPYVNVGN